MAFRYSRTVRFKDTDAAGVVYFANVLAMCHEACEESLAISGTNLKVFFSNPAFAIPITHASVDFLRPTFCGDQLLILLIAKQCSGDEFEIGYRILEAATDQVVAKAITKHVCIEPISRTRKGLPPEIVQWLKQWGV